MTNVDYIGEISASVQEGGWRASGNIFGDADRLQWYQEVETWYYLYRGGAWEPQPRLGFRGLLLPDPWRKTFQSSDAPWTAFTAQEVLKRMELQGIYFAEAASPANQHQLTVGDTLADIMDHLLGKSGQYGHWNGVIGIWPEGFARTNIETANSVAPGVYDLKGGAFWSRGQEIANADTHILVVDKYNTIQYKQHPMYGATLPDPVMDFTSSHILEPLQITPRNTEEVGQVRVQGTTPGGLQLRGVYPTAPTAGPVVVEGGILATSNSLLATIAERKYRYRNRSHSVTMTLGGCVGLLFDLYDRVSITYTDLADGIDWSAKKFWVEDIKVRLTDYFNGVTTMKLEAEN